MVWANVAAAVLSTIAVSTADGAATDGTAVPVGLTDGFVNAFWAGAVIAFVGVLVSIFMVRGRDLQGDVDALAEAVVVPEAA